MMFLQGHGISTLFAVRIYKEYGDNAIVARSAQDPYRLASDIYGIGFFLSGQGGAQSRPGSWIAPSALLLRSKHVLAASRDQGHCYLTDRQIDEGVKALIELDLGAALLPTCSLQMQRDNQLRVPGN